MGGIIDCNLQMRELRQKGIKILDHSHNLVSDNRVLSTILVSSGQIMKGDIYISLEPIK